MNKDTNTWIGGKYTDDIIESASFHFIAENTSFSPINPRNLNISQFYNSLFLGIRTLQFGFPLRIECYFETIFSCCIYIRTILSNTMAHIFVLIDGSYYVIYTKDA